MKQFRRNPGRTSLGYETPDLVYQMASGGGAMIVDKYKKVAVDDSKVVLEMGQRHSAV